MREKMVSISKISSYTTLLGGNYYSYFVREKNEVLEMLSNFQKITQFNSVAEFYLFHIWVCRLSLYLMYDKGPCSYLEEL